MLRQAPTELFRGKFIKFCADFLKILWLLLISENYISCLAATYYSGNQGNGETAIFPAKVLILFAATLNQISRIKLWVPFFWSPSSFIFQSSLAALSLNQPRFGVETHILTWALMHSGKDQVRFKQLALICLFLQFIWFLFCVFPYTFQELACFSRSCLPGLFVQFLTWVSIQFLPNPHCLAHASSTQSCRPLLSSLFVPRLARL